MRLVWSGLTALLACVFVLQVPADPSAARDVSAAALPAQDSGEFSLAVLRRDGVVIPFAHYNGRRWSNPWRVPGKPFEIPLSMDDVPDNWWPRRRPVTSWTAWPLKGNRASIESLAPITVLAHCQRGLGIRTTYKAAEVPPALVQPYPKDGLAVAGNVVVEAPAMIDATSPEWRAVDAAVQREVTNLEDRLIKDLSERSGQFQERFWSHPASPRERGEVVFTPELIARVSPRALYFEGVKTYGQMLRATRSRDGLKVVRPGACNILTYAAGWVLLDEAGKPKVTAAADITDCNREGMVYSLPLGLIRRGDTIFWVVQVSGYGYERYEVLEVKGDRVKSAIAVPGGWCG